MRYTLAILTTFLISLNATAQTIDQMADSILALMTLEEKVGQMTQVERGEFDNLQDIATYGIGSILSGGGSSPTPNTAGSWASMYDNFQSIALQSRLGIPLLYGVDAVHTYNNVRGAVIFPTTSEWGAPGTRLWSGRQTRLSPGKWRYHRYRLDLRPLHRRAPR
ncbi:MAG: hypothetical protein H6559_35975 [Lewinellaceae bacterium]|nr:hypothetical protein [Lewinellaceae bacterium]